MVNVGRRWVSQRARPNLRRPQWPTGDTMLCHHSIRAVMLVGALCVTIADAAAWDDSKYPDFSGQWRSFGGQLRFYAPTQKPPLTPEYQAMFDAIRAEGGQGTSNMTYLCHSPGMPRVTNGYGEMEFVIAPTTFHILADHIYDN